MGEPEPAGELGHALLVRRVEVRVGEADGHGVDALGLDGPQLGPHLGLVEGAEDAEHVARGAADQLPGDFRQGRPAVFGGVLVVRFHRQPLRDFDHLVVEQLGLDDAQVEQSGPRLVADLQQIPKALVDDEGVSRALPFQQCCDRWSQW